MSNSGSRRRCESARMAISSLFAVLLVIAATPSKAQESETARRGPPPELFSTSLPDVPGNHLEIVELSYPPKSGSPSTAEDYSGEGHHHPGSVYVYVTQGAIRIGVEGVVSVVEAGGSFFEPPLAHHMFTESASSTEGARAIAVMIVPDGQSSVIRGKAEQTRE